MLLPFTRMWSTTRGAGMDIKRSGSQPSAKGPAEWFTGTVRIDPAFTLTLDNYNGTEKISDLPKKLSTRGGAEGVAPLAGDVAYYAPWGNLAIFYKDLAYSRGLVKLGRIESSVSAFERSGRLRVALDLIEE
jgi:hypothetical protein